MILKSSTNKLKSSYMKKNDNRLLKTKISLKSHGAILQNLESQVGQMAKAISEKPKGGLLSNT